MLEWSGLAAAGLLRAGEWTLEAEGRDALAAGGRAARPTRDGITIYWKSEGQGLNQFTPRPPPEQTAPRPALPRG